MDYSNAIPSTNGHGRPPGSKPPTVIDAFDSAEPAPEYAPVPPDVYTARVLRGEYYTTRKGDDAYRLRFEIAEGEHDGKTLIRIFTFGEKAIRYSKRDLALFGLTTSAKLLSPFPEPGREYVVRLVVALQLDNDGIQRMAATGRFGLTPHLP